jgi:two-component system, NtrC family, sensor kinase
MNLSRPPALPSLRTELLVTIGVLAAAALLIAVLSVMLMAGEAGSPDSAIFLSVLIAADVAVMVAFGAFKLDRVVNRPLGEVVRAAEAIAAGDLERRVPPGHTREFNTLATSLNHMTERLLEEQTQLMRAEKMAIVGRLATGVAHEIGNPLGAINGYAHLLRSRTDGSESAAEALAGLDREAGRIDRIVRGLIDFARPRRETPALIEIGESLRGTMELLTAQGALRGVDFRVDITAEPLPVRSDRHEVDQAFVNIVLNAVDATDGTGSIAVVARRRKVAELLAGRPRRSGETEAVQLPRTPNPRVQGWAESADAAGEVAQVIIADSGPGIDAADVERIFDPFFTTKEPGRGTGLGLAIVARTTHNAGGTVWVQRSREGGAAFVLLFPLAASGSGA